MTNDEMVDKWLASIGMKRVQGHTLETILPFLMLDVNYQIFLKTVRPLESKHEMKLWKQRWIDAYNRLNKQFFRAFTVDEQNEVVDKMDDFDNWIANDVMIAKVQIMNFLQDLDFDIQKTCAELMIANIMAQSAQIVWGNCYKTSTLYNQKNMDIQAIEKASSRFMNLFHSAVSDRHVNPNQSKPIVAAVDVLCQKMIKWLYKDRPQEKPQEVQLQTKK